MMIMLNLTKRCYTGLVRRMARGGAARFAAVVSGLLALHALPAAAATIEAIEFSSLPGDRTEIRLQFDGTSLAPSGYTI